MPNALVESSLLEEPADRFREVEVDTVDEHRSARGILEWSLVSVGLWLLILLLAW